MNSRSDLDFRARDTSTRHAQDTRARTTARLARSRTTHGGTPSVAGTATVITVGLIRSTQAPLSAVVDDAGVAHEVWGEREPAISLTVEIEVQFNAVVNRDYEDVEDVRLL